jgi:hypothetical protein
MSDYNLLSVSNDAKTIKGESKGYLTGVLYLAPHKLSGINICPSASPQCIASCLNGAGRGVFPNVQAARLRKTKLFHEDRSEFFTLLRDDINRLVNAAKSRGLAPCVRLNGTSDIPWELTYLPSQTGMKHTILSMYAGVQFYDYTKIESRALAWARGLMPENYHLTFSYSGGRQPRLPKILETRCNVAVVFRNTLPETYLSRRVIDGDTSDLRFRDPRGVIVGLTAKGPARKADAGFVVDLN